MSNLPEKARPKLQELQIESDDLNSVLDVGLRSVKMGRPPLFPETAQGFEDFKQESIAYLEHVKKTNESPDCENKVVPTVETWAAYLGTSRMTILSYEKSRPGQWQEFIGQMKNIISSCQVQLALRQKIPSVLAIFILANNAGYVNASEFHLTMEPTPTKELLERRAIEQEIMDSGLVWNETKGEFEPM